jgi:hypothetical protein
MAHNKSRLRTQVVIRRLCIALFRLAIQATPARKLDHQGEDARILFVHS